MRIVRFGIVLSFVVDFCVGCAEKTLNPPKYFRTIPQYGFI